MENENAITEDQNMNFEGSESVRSNTQAISNGDTHDDDGTMPIFVFTNFIQISAARSDLLDSEVEY